MKTFNISTSNKIVEKTIYGSKSYWLSWLIQHEYNVPSCFFISAVSENDLKELISFLKSDKDFNKQITKFKNSDNQFELAIRSSALNEDSIEHSFAGHFKSFVETVSFDQIFLNIANVVKSVKENDSTDNQKMGIVIQKKIDSKFSGVIFSSNPLTASKKEILISVVEGMGEQLVSGKSAGEDILVKFTSNNPEVPVYKTNIEINHILRICKISKSIEFDLNAPVDIEWCIDIEKNELHILQCRPITTIFPTHTGIIPIKLSNEKLIPFQLIENDKVKIRLIAQKNAIDVSNAYLVINNNSSKVDKDKLKCIKPESKCKGYSVVLIFPKTLSGNIIRHFAEKEIHRQNSAYRTCQRYNVRTYQNYSNLAGIIESMQSKCCEEYWFCILIIQEIFEPLFTGIAKKIDDGFLIEIAKGHFVPKGVVPTSQYILNNEIKVIHKNEILQDFSYNILNGVVSKESVNSLISINENILVGIVENLMPVLSTNIQAVEFGLLYDDTKKSIVPFLIDLVDDNSQAKLSSKLISEGVISMGKRSGYTNILDSKLFGNNSFEIHFHDHFESKNTFDKEIIFVTKTPDIALLAVLKHYNNEKIGFIFREGSALSHFSIVLREKKIPAIVVGNQINFTENEIIHIDAISENIKGNERVTYGKSCVTTYVNPDLDGISSSIVLSNYKTSIGKNFTPVYYGELDNETIFALNYFNLEFPKQVISIDEFESVILVDTHHPAQLVKDFPFERVIEVLDHHPDGSPLSFINASIQNEEIGSICTLITEHFKNEHLFIPENIAGILALGIISNTLNFTAPSTTKRDKVAFSWLQLLVCISEDLIMQLFESRSSIDSLESNIIISKNLKEFNWSNSKIGISQVEMININKLINRADFCESLIEVKRAKNLDYIIFSGVDLIAHNTFIVVPNQETLEIINKGMGYNFNSIIMEVDKILLRKTDFIPKLKVYFNEK